ncbi:MAG: hypothetical protein Q7R70_05280 [Candidatus Diapherotrites archaeon]|nr:hypothetical protein [Candidatus Diapherotrites archaeon]
MKKLAILTILALFSVLLFGCIGSPTFPQTSPNDVASDMIKNQVDQPSEYVQSQVVVFDSQNSNLSSKVISANSKQLASEQICIGTGDFAGNSNFHFPSPSSGGGVMLIYTGSGPQRASIGVICDDSQSLMNDLQDLQIQAGDMQCGNGNTLPENTAQTVCLLILKSA